MANSDDFENPVGGSTWPEFVQLASEYGGKVVDDDALVFEFQVEGPESKPVEVYLFREADQPGLDIVTANSAVAFLDSIDLVQVFRSYGDLNIGSLRIINSDRPMIALGMNMPLPVVSILDRSSTMAIFKILAYTARKVARRVDGIV